MKLQTNLIKQSVMIVLACVLITSCKEGGQSNDLALKKCKEKIEALEKENEELRAQLADDDQKHRVPKQIIKSDFAEKIYHLYDEREKLINEVVGQDGEGEDFKATRSLFYDINDLQKYIKYVKKLSRKAGERPSGFRFYFALYPDSYVRDGENKKYASRQTFFIAPTKKVKDSVGNIEHLGYTLDNEFNVKLLRDKIGLDSRVGKDGKVYQKAGFFSFSTSLEEDNSLIANELAGSPPMGKDEQ